jgi:hypothetical protein
MTDLYTISNIEVDSNGLSKDTYIGRLMYAADLKFKDEIIDFYKEDFVKRLHSDGCNATKEDVQVHVEYSDSTLQFTIWMKYIPCKSLVNSLERDTVYGKLSDPVRYATDGTKQYRYAGINPRLNVCIYTLDEE